jgi:O-methyltransferase involved in polyketide biosynthesis
LARGGVHYCAADFSAGKDAFGIAWLSEQGVDRDASTVFVMDGVSYFLSPDAFRHVVEVMAEFPPGTQVVFDYAYAEILAGKTYRGSEAFKASLAKMGEPVAGGISEFGIVEYLRQFGFELVSLLRPEDIESRYLTSSKGTSTAPYGFLNIIRARKVAQ